MSVFKERRMFHFFVQKPQKRIIIQPSVRGLVSAPLQHLFRNLLENGLYLDISAHCLEHFCREILYFIVTLYSESSFFMVDIKH